MAGHALLVVLLMAAPAADAPEPARAEAEAGAEQAERLMKSCGLPNVRARYDKKQKEAMLDARAVGASSDEKLACAAKVSLATGLRLRLKKGLQRRYDRIHDTVLRDLSVSQGRDWLERRERLSDLPAYESGNDAQFASELEAFCGDAARGALQSQYGPHSFSPDWIRSLPPDAAHVEALMCMTNGAAAAAFRLGFVGREAAKPGD